MNVIDIMNPPEAIWIGRKGENVFREVPIDCSGYIEKHPNATITAMYQSGENEPFPVVLEQDGTTFTWKPRSEEIADEYGRIEIVLTDSEVVGASKIVECFVDESLIDGTEHPDELAPAWSVEMVQDVTEQADRAEGAVSHYPQIVNGVWFVWDAEQSKFVSTGISAQGEDGVSPTVTVEAIEGGHRVTITDADGAHTFDVMDGEGGSSGGAVESVNGKTGAVVLDASDVGALPDDTVIPSQIGQLSDNVGLVHYNSQTLADAQKAQARTNIGAASMSDIPSLAAYRTASAQDAIDAAQDSAIAAKYTKPSGGIPASDLASGVIPTVPQMATEYDRSDWTSGKTVDAATLKTEFEAAMLVLNDIDASKADASSVYTKAEVDQKLVGAMDYKGTKATVSALPTSGNKTGDVWSITADGSEWAWNGSTWEELGTAVDLSGYRTASAQDAIDAAQDSAISAKYTKPSSGIPASDMASGAIPTKTSDLTNDSGFLTPSQIVTEGDTVIDQTLLIKGAAADALSVREAFVANIQPLFVDVLSGNWLGSQNAAYSNGAENAEKYFTFRGAAGADTVSVTGGTASISSLTNNQWWRGVVEYDDGTCVPTMVSYQGTADTLHIFPALTTAVTSGKIMPSLYSIHATSLGYKWYAQYVYGSNAKHCLKSKPIARWLARNSDAIPFTKINSFWWGENNGNVQRNLQTCNATVKHLHINIDKTASVSTPKGFSWTVSVGGKTGYVEILMSGNYAADFFEFPQDEGFIIELYQDGVLSGTYRKTTVHYERICLDFSDCDTMELRVYATGNSVTHTIELTEVSVWETGAFDRAELLPFGSVPAQLFDSWGVQFDSATATEFKRLHTLKLGVTAPWENHSLGGATSAWGRAWFYENVVKYHPTHVLIDFIINDSNSRVTSGFAPTVAGPDGTEYDNVMDTVDEYIDNMISIIKMAMSYGIQPIICMAPYSDNEKPEWSYRLIDKWSVDPERFEFSVLKGAESPQSLSDYAKKSWVESKGYQTASDVQTAIAAIPDELPAVTASDNGKFLRVVSGAWAAQAVPSAEGASF